MRINILCVGLLIWIIFPLLAVGQEHHFDKQAVYKMTYRPDSTDYEDIKQLDMELLLNETLSIFQQVRNRQADSVLYYHSPIERRYTSDRQGITMRPIPRFNYQIWKQNDKVQYYDPLYGGPDMEGREELYHYEEEIADMAWHLTDEVDSIGPYHCQKAELWYGGRNWIAWFSPDIPINDGPYKFAGLPGLIVRMHDAKEHWNFDLVSFRKVDILHPTWFKEWQTVFPATREKLKEDRAAIVDYLGRMIFTTTHDSRFPEPTEKELQERYDDFQKRLAADNNGIELLP